MRNQWSFELTSVVPASAETVWHRVVTPEGINDEMRPWMTMTLPHGVGEVSIEMIRLGVPVGRAWLRLFGVLPFDYDRLMLTELEPGRRFHEESTMLSMRRWVHDRTVEATTGGAALVTDRVILQPRVVLWPAGPLLRILLRAFFGHRHRRLRRHFAR
ncbi:MULTISPECIES: hypothetical protein [Pseudofrankia]|uniref:hypothetical protein n=1 Tax=Pseudofrankia TaxID=2994363 RepID=UPI000234BA50|nr:MULTISPECIES: hypothetical protein [Pseudofrankia]